jgi:hypothetical protein
MEPGNFRKNTLQSSTKHVKMPWIELKTINNGERITSDKLRLRLYSFSTVGTGEQNIIIAVVVGPQENQNPHA